MNEEFADSIDLKFQLVFLDLSCMTVLLALDYAFLYCFVLTYFDICCFNRCLGFFKLLKAVNTNQHVDKQTYGQQAYFMGRRLWYIVC